MRQMLHIFKKDVNYLRFDILVVLMLTAAFAIVNTMQAGPGKPLGNGGSAATMVTYLLPLAWCVLIAQLIYAETLPGDTQFWITRPYAWRALLCEKVLFIVAFVNLPLLVADAIIVHAFGFSLIHEMPGLLWTQVLLSATILLPVAALCAITKGFAQLIAIAFVLCLALLGWNTASPGMMRGVMWGPIGWVASYYVIATAMAGAIAILIWQYARRQTAYGQAGAALSIIVAFAGSALIPWTTAFAIQSRLSKLPVDESKIEVSFDSEKKWLARSLVDIDGSVQIELPLQIAGLPANTYPKPDGLTLTAKAQGGEVWQTNRLPWQNIDWEGSVLSLKSFIDPSFYKKVKDSPALLHGTLYFTLYGHTQRTTIPAQHKFVRVPSMGVCSAIPGARRGLFLFCNSAFRPQPDLVSLHFESNEGNADWHYAAYAALLSQSYSPFPAELNINPVSQYSTFRAGEASGVIIESIEPLAHISRNFEIRNLRLGDYEVRVTPLSTPYEPSNRPPKR